MSDRLPAWYGVRWAYLEAWCDEYDACIAEGMDADEAAHTADAWIRLAPAWQDVSTAPGFAIKMRQ